MKMLVVETEIVKEVVRMVERKTVVSRSSVGKPTSLSTLDPRMDVPTSDLSRSSRNSNFFFTEIENHSGLERLFQWNLVKCF